MYRSSHSVSAQKKLFLACNFDSETFCLDTFQTFLNTSKKMLEHDHKAL